MQSEHAACAETIASLRSEVEALKVRSHRKHSMGCFSHVPPRGIKLNSAQSDLRDQCNA